MDAARIKLGDRYVSVVEAALLTDELLGALRAFVAGADAGHVTVEVDNAARAAIAKANGHD